MNRDGILGDFGGFSRAEYGGEGGGRPYEL